MKVNEEILKRLDIRGVDLDVALRRLLERVPLTNQESRNQEIRVLNKCYIEQNEEKVARDSPETQRQSRL